MKTTRKIKGFRFNKKLRLFKHNVILEITLYKDNTYLFMLYCQEKSLLENDWLLRPIPEDSYLLIFFPNIKYRTNLFEQNSFMFRLIEKYI
jgi:hypothetical protein